VRPVSWTQYRNALLRFARNSLVQYASCSDSALDKARLDEALSGSSTRRLFRVLAAANHSRVGIDWQRFDIEFWRSRGHAGVNFKNGWQPDAADGVLCGCRIQAKFARPLVPRSGPYKGDFGYRTYIANKVAPFGSGVFNLILMTSDVLQPQDWPVFFGTTEELAETVRRVRISNPVRDEQVLGSMTWNVRERAVLTHWGEASAEHTLSSYVELRNSCTH
jgi:hypothetical protein